MTMSETNAAQTCTSRHQVLRTVVWTAWMLLTHLVAFVLVMWVLGTIVPQFLAMFAEFEAEVPPVSILVIDLSHIVTAYWYLVLPLALVIDAALLFGLRCLPAAANWLATVWATLVWLGMLLLLAMVVVGLYVPLDQLLTDLS
jgi:type II secretory pathway component PulF